MNLFCFLLFIEIQWAARELLEGAFWDAGDQTMPLTLL